jgi:hypothetical protein
MNTLVEKFVAIKGTHTRQVAKFFCIPATVCTALRLLGVNSATQEAIRDAWYRAKNASPELDLDAQMTDASFGVAEVFLHDSSHSSGIKHELFERPRDDDPLDLTKADEALSFVERHVCAGHPVIVSTWNPALVEGHLAVLGFHMLLVLDFDRSRNEFIGHDPELDNLFHGKISNPKPVQLAQGEIVLDVGLRCSVTHSDYCCLALWRAT